MFGKWRGFVEKPEESEVKREPASDFERELEKRASSELLDDIYEMRDNLGPAVQDLTPQDREMISALVVKARMEGVDESKLRAFILQREVVETESATEEHQENMDISSRLALQVLYEQNSSVASLIDKVRIGEVEFSRVQEQLLGAGYQLPEDFESVFNDFLNELHQEAA